MQNSPTGFGMRFDDRTFFVVETTRFLKYTVRNRDLADIVQQASQVDPFAASW